MRKKITWKLKEGATWRGKLEAEHANHGKIVEIPEHMRKGLGVGTLLIPRPLDVDALLRKIRKGKLVTTTELRAALAAAEGTTSTCPLTTGIFLRMVAEAAEEDRRRGKQRITPYWRCLKPGGKLNEKYPGGTSAQARLLEEEGHTIRRGKGKQPPVVVDFERCLVRRASS